VLGFCQWLGSTPWSVALHESILVYPIVESVHVLTLCLFLGLVVMLDLRLLGVTMLKTPVSEAIRRLAPWTIAGFVVMVITGSLLFYAIPVKTVAGGLSLVRPGGDVEIRGQLRSGLAAQPIPRRRRSTIAIVPMDKAKPMKWMLWTTGKAHSGPFIALAHGLVVSHSKNIEADIPAYPPSSCDDF
jgi:hypothetical protein